MKTNAKFWFLLFLFFVFKGNSSNCQTIDSNFVDGIVYVKIVSTSTMELSPYSFSDPVLNGFYTTYNIDTITKPFPGISAELDKTYRIKFSQIAQIDNLISDLQTLTYIEYAEKAPIYRTDYIPNDLHPAQWSLTKINAIGAWDISTGSTGIKIAIVDNAVSTIHEDLINNIWINPGEVPGNFLDDDLNGFADDVNGWDAADGDKNPNPPGSATTSSPFVHGTHCAGIASAATNNGVGIASIGFKIKIIPVKCSPDLSSDGGATITNAYDGVYYAIRANADVISMSWGGYSGSFSTGENMMNAANALGIVLVAAAGNSNTSAPHYPSGYNYVISVGATDQTDQKASFSNFGPSVDVMAPGTAIYSTLSGAVNAYGYISGTSMACPLAAGLCGLILSQSPSLSPATVQTYLKNGCENIDVLNPSYAGQLGSGRINAFNSLQYVSVSENVNDSDDFYVFPNPSNGIFTLLFPDNKINSVSVYNINGEMVFNEMVNPNDDRLNINLDLSKGLYIIKASGDKNHYSKKIVLK